MSNIFACFNYYIRTKAYYGIPAGTIIGEVGEPIPSVQDCLVPCDGAPYSQAQYPELFAVVGMVYSPPAVLPKPGFWNALCGYFGLEVKTVPNPKALRPGLFCVPDLRTHMLVKP